MDVNDEPLPSEQAPRPGPVADSQDERLADLRRRVVDPVVQGMTRPGEVESVTVRWGLDGRDGDVWVVVETTAERFQDLLLSPFWRAEPWEVEPPGSDEEIAAHLADRFQDWLAESRLAWGQFRPTTYRLPRG